MTTKRDIDIHVHAKDETGNVFQQIGEKAHALKQQFGRRSALGEGMEFLFEGAQLFALTFAADKIGEIAKGTRELMLAAKEGKQQFSDLAEGVVKSIPVMGQFYSLFRNVSDLAWDGASMAAEALGDKDLAESLKSSTRLNEETKAKKGFEQKSLELFGRIQKENRAYGMNPFEKEKLDLRDKNNDEIKEVQAQLKEIQHSGLDEDYIAQKAREAASLIKEIQKRAKREEADLDKKQEGERVKMIQSAEDAIAKNKLTMARLLARDAKSLWAVQAKETAESFNEQIWAIGHELEYNKFLTPEQRDSLRHKQASIQDTRDATLTQEQRQFGIGVGNDRRFGIYGGLLGASSGLLNNFGALAPAIANNPAFKKMAEDLQARQFVTGIDAQMAALANNPHATKGQKDAMSALQSQAHSYFEFATSSLRDAPSVAALRLGGAQEVGRGYGGFADAARERYAAERAKNPETLRLQKQMVSLLEAIHKAIAARGLDEPLFPTDGGGDLTGD